jgi:hypothetical protein
VAFIIANPCPTQIRRPPLNGRYAKRGALLGRVTEKAPGIKAGRVLPDRRVAVSGPDRDEDQRAGREAIPADDVVSDRHALHVPDRWVQTHRLLKAGARPGQALDVVVGGDATVQYGVDLGLQPLSGRWRSHSSTSATVRSARRDTVR